MFSYIYALSDPISNEIRYIGKTNNLHRRYNNHLVDKHHCCRVRWIQSLLNAGLKPNLIIIEVLNDKDSWEEREIYWIAHYKNIGCNLTNSSNGGAIPPDCTGYHLVKSEQGRKNIIAALIKRNKSPKMREVARKNGIAGKGRKRSPEIIARMSKRMQGTHHSLTEKARQALVEWNKSRIYDPKKMSRISLIGWNDPIKRDKIRAQLIERNKRPDIIQKQNKTREQILNDPIKGPKLRAKRSEIMKNMWNDPVKGPELRKRLIERNKSRSKIK